MSSAGPLPPPLIPLPKRRASDCEPAEEEEGREAPTLPQDLGINVGLEVGEPEVAAEAYSEMGGSPREEEREELSDTELDDRGTAGWNKLPECTQVCYTGSFIILFLPFGLRFHLQSRLPTHLQPETTNHKSPRKNLIHCLTLWQKSDSHPQKRNVHLHCLIMTWLSLIPAINKVK